MLEVNNSQVNANQLGFGTGCGAMSRITRGTRVGHAWRTRGTRVGWPSPLSQNSCVSEPSLATSERGLLAIDAVAAGDCRVHADVGIRRLP